MAPTTDPHPVHLHQVSSGSPGQMNSPVGLGEALRSHSRAGAAPRLPGHFGARSYSHSDLSTLAETEEGHCPEKAGERM